MKHFQIVLKVAYDIIYDKNTVIYSYLAWKGGRVYYIHVTNVFYQIWYLKRSWSILLASNIELQLYTTHVPLYTLLAYFYSLFKLGFIQPKNVPQRQSSRVNRKEYKRQRNIGNTEKVNDAHTETKKNFQAKGYFTAEMYTFWFLNLSNTYSKLTIKWFWIPNDHCLFNFIDNKYRRYRWPIFLKQNNLKYLLL